MLGSAWVDDGGVQMPNVLRALSSLFAAPERANPVNTTLALDFFCGDGAFEAAVTEHVRKHAARKTRSAWRQQLTGE